MLEIASLGSGSSGNALVVRSAHTRLLVDCGFTLKETRQRLSALGLCPSELDGLLITHEHGDHIKGAGPLARKYGVPVWMTAGTHRCIRDKRFPRLELFHAHDRFALGDIDIDPFPTPHDAAESCHFVFSHGAARFACVTDLGACTPHIESKLAGVHGVLVECNYDAELLRNGPYPPSLKARIRSDFGHLGNHQAAHLLASLDHPALDCILLGHLSEQNNTDEAARSTVSAVLKRGVDRVAVLEQHRHSEWFTITGHGHGSLLARSTDSPVAAADGTAARDRPFCGTVSA